MDDACANRCQICQKTFKSKNTLRGHLTTHADPRFKCTDCGAGFFRKSYLRTHRLVKHGDGEKKEFVCKICPKTYTNHQSFQNHQRTHNLRNENAFSCKLCDKKFSSDCGLQKHQQVVHDQQRLRCFQCLQTFTHRHNLEK